MLVLALETSLAPGSIALGEGGDLWLHRLPPAGRDFSTWLAPALAEALELARGRGRELDGVAVALGPGSFTGLRVGLSAAKGLCLARGLPLVGVPTADLIAAQVPLGPPSLLVVVPFNPRELFLTHYRPRNVPVRPRPTPSALSPDAAWQRDGETRLLPFSELLGGLRPPASLAGPLSPERRETLLRVYGEGVRVYDDLVPDSRVLCRLGEAMLRRGDTLAPARAVPHYATDPTPVRRSRGERV